MSNKLKKISIPIFEYWTLYLQAIQKSLTNDYFYYKTGTIVEDKLEKTLIKLNDYYRLSETPKERFNRFKNGFSVTVMYILKVQSLYHFIIMTRSNLDRTGIFFERENYADARDKKHRINFNECYEFVRVNKESYTFNGKEVDAKNGVWTVKISEKEQNKILREFNIGLMKRNYMKIKQICYGLTHWIGFAGVREDYVVMKDKLEKRFTKFHSSQPKPKY